MLKKFFKHTTNTFKSLFIIFKHIRVQGIDKIRPPITSEKKCTPKYILENPTNIANKINKEKNTALLNLFVFLVSKYQSTI